MQIYLERNKDGTIRAERVHVESWDFRIKSTEEDSCFLEELNGEYENNKVKEPQDAANRARLIIPKYYSPRFILVFPPHKHKSKSQKTKS